MTALDTIFTRKSVRYFSDRKIGEDEMHTILHAGMSGPCCVNARDWSFIVVRSKDTLAQMARINGAPAKPLLRADAAILICGDLSRAFPPAKEYWVIDGAIAAQNMTLAAHALGIGSVWLGTWPQMDRVKGQAQLFGLPEEIVPHSILALGYPEEEAQQTPAKEKWEQDRVHFERWEG